MGLNPWSSHGKDLEMLLEASFVNTQQNEVRTKCKVEQSWKRSCDHPYTSV